MAVSRELPRLTVSILFAVLSLSCSANSILVVTDPYIEKIHENRWAPASFEFAARAFLNGYQVSVESAEDQNELKRVVENREIPPGIVIVSPLNASGLSHIRADVKEFVIIGRDPEVDAAGDSRIIRVELDRTAAMEEIGLSAAKIASKENKPAMALFSTVNSKRAGEMETLKNAYFSELQEELSSTNVNSFSGELSSDFADKAQECSVLLLFAGPANIVAMQMTEEMGIPVITEGHFGSGAWNKRILASVEDDQKSLVKVLMEIIDDKEAGPVIGYPAKIIDGRVYRSKKKWFDALVP